MNDGREISPPATMQAHIDLSAKAPTSCSNFRDEVFDFLLKMMDSVFKMMDSVFKMKAEVGSVYYEEMIDL